MTGGPDLPLSVCGCNFTGSTAINWNGSALTTNFVSANQIDATVPATDTANIGADNVTVTDSSQTSAPQTFFVGNEGGDGYAEVVINQQTKDIVDDPVNNAIYMSVPGSAPTNGNAIAVVSLASASITSTPFAGSNPDALAIADDSSYLYAGIDGSASVQRFTLPSLTKDISYSLGRDSFFGPYYALDLQVAPGAPHTTAVSLANSGVSPAAQGGIEIWDDSTMRTTTAAGGFDLYDSIQWGADDTALYAENYESSGFDFYILTVSASGVVLDSDLSGTFSGYDERIHYDNSLIYADYGQVVDTSGNPVGSFSPTLLSVMVPDSTLNKAFFVSSDTGAIQSFNQTEFSSIGSITLPDLSDRPLRIIRWGTNGLAINTYEGPVYLIGGNFVH